LGFRNEAQPEWTGSTRRPAEACGYGVADPDAEGDAVSWLSWIVVGFIAGALAKGVTGVKGAGCIGTILIGIAGGIIGGIIFSALGGEGINEFSLYSLLVAFVGATLLLFIYSALTGGRRRRSY
jgi:uncharacterized membrane protein YeaQ/YmgE (transglycosylase-associated protein family)